MKIADVMMAGLIALLVGISFINPGGLIVALLLVTILVAFRVGVPFARDYYVSAHSGKVGRKAQSARKSQDGDSGNGGRR